MAFQPLMSFFAIQAQQEKLPKINSNSTTGPRSPVTVYDNWSAYDELSDNIPLTEELAMRELNDNSYLYPIR